MTNPKIPLKAEPWNPDTTFKDLAGFAGFDEPMGLAKDTTITPVEAEHAFAGDMILPTTALTLAPVIQVRAEAFYIAQTAAALSRDLALGLEPLAQVREDHATLWRSLRILEDIPPITDQHTLELEICRKTLNVMDIGIKMFTNICVQLLENAPKAVLSWQDKDSAQDPERAIQKVMPVGLEGRNDPTTPGYTRPLVVPVDQLELTAAGGGTHNTPHRGRSI